VASTWGGRAFDVVEKRLDWVKVAAWIKRSDVKNE
jgi:hypothetical protein